MLSKWVPLLKPRLRTREIRFRHSLVRTVLIVLLVTSLFPVLLIGTLNMFRSRDLLRNQVTHQSEAISNYQVKQIGEYALVRGDMLDRMLTDNNFAAALATLLSTPSSSEENSQARTQISYNFHENPGTRMDKYFDQMFIIRSNSTIALATDNKWIIEKFGNLRVRDAFITSLMGTDKSTFVFETQADSASALVLYTTRTFHDPDGAAVATLIATHKPGNEDIPYRTLIDSGSFLPGAQGLYFTATGKIVGLEENAWVDLPPNEQIRTSLLPMTSLRASQKHFSARLNDQAVSVYASWLPEYNIGVLLTVSEATLLGNNPLLDPFNLVLLVVSLAISGGLILLGSTGIIRPLVQLAESADNFARGKWSERAQVNREDEIGMLAHSFNRMAEELSSLYQSMESAVESRTTTLRTASEVAHLATSTTRLDETLGRTVELITERFHYYHVAIYLFDETRQNLVMQEASGIMAAQMKRIGDRVETSSDTLIGKVAADRRAVIISDIQTDPLFHKNELLPDTRSEIAIPILLGDEVLGVMDLQSTLVEAFNQETVAVFQTLANQISSALQAARLLESTRASYQETSLLYRAARQVTLAKDENELVQNIADAFVQLPCIGAVLSIDGDNFKIQVVTDSKTGRVERGLQSLNIPVGRMGRLLEQNPTVLIEDVSQPSDYDNLVSFLRRRGSKSAVLVPVLKNGSVAKVLILSPHGAQTAQSSLQAYINLADVVGSSLEKFDLLKGLNVRVLELQVLTRFSEAISAETDLHNLYFALHQQVIQTFGEGIEFAVATYNAAKNEVEFPYFHENGVTFTRTPVQMGEGLTSAVIQKGKPLLFKTEQSIRSASAIIDGVAPKSWLGVPLIFAGKTLGAILIQDLTSENRFNQEDANLFMTLAPQIATAVRNTQLYTESQAALLAYDQERFLLNTLLDNMPEGISFKDTRGQYIRASESTARIYHQAAEDLVGKTSYDLMDHEAADALFQEEQMVMSAGKPEIGLVRRSISPDGTENWQHTSRIPIRTANDEPYGLLIIERDITGLKQAEALAQRRAEQVLTAAEIARDTTGTLDVADLLQKSVNLVRERFGFYHASIFLIDAAGEYAVLRESTGAAGEQMVRAGHRLAVGSKSIVGQVTQSGTALIVNNVTDDPTHLPNPLLPETRSELAIPLEVGERILGALDVQSTQMDAFNDEDVSVLEILADQLAVAVVNGDLYLQSQQLLDKHRLLRQVTIAASASTNLEDALHSVVAGLRGAEIGDRIGILLVNEQGELQLQASAGYESSRNANARVVPGHGVAGQAALEKRPVLVNDTLATPQYRNLNDRVRSELAIPILFSDELMGVLDLESASAAAFDENDLEILGALGNNLGGVIANIRLVNQVRQQVLRERQLFDVTSQIRHSVDMETILETSTRELARALGARRASIRITAGTAPLTSPNENTGDAATKQQDGGSNGSGNNGNGRNGKAHGGEDKP